MSGIPGLSFLSFRPIPGFLLPDVGTRLCTSRKWVRGYHLPFRLFHELFAHPTPFPGCKMCHRLMRAAAHAPRVSFAEVNVFNFAGPDVLHFRKRTEGRTEGHGTRKRRARETRRDACQHSDQRQPSTQSGLGQPVSSFTAFCPRQS